MQRMSNPGGILSATHQFKFVAILLAAILVLLFKNSKIHNCSHKHLRMAESTKAHWSCALNEMEGEQWAMVEKNATQFLVKDRPFYVHGFNTYWLMVFAADLSTRGKVSEVFRQALAVGLNVCRTWAFNDAGWRALQISPSVYDEEVFKGLDFVVSEARRNSIRLILSFCNNWEDYGGKAQYVRWGKEAGVNITCDDEFFTDLTIKGYYKAHVDVTLTISHYKILNRILTRVNTFTNVMYKDDATIFAWELINEPRCLLDSSGDSLQAWIEEMAYFVKSIDPIHLLEIGMEGFYGPSAPEKLHLNPHSYMGQVGTDFIRNHQTTGIDFASVHIYSDSWLSDSLSDAHFNFVESWMQDHMDDAEKILNMPVVFGEFGVSMNDERFTLEFRETFFSTVHNMLLKSRKRGGSGGGSLLWQLFPEGTEHMNDGYAIILAKSQATSNMLSLHSTRIQELSSKYTTKSFSSGDGAFSHDEL